jgi:hypothetical protein
MKHWVLCAVIFGLSSCSGHRENEFVPSRMDVSKEEYDAEYAEYLERNRAWDNFMPMIIIILATAAMLNANGGGMQSTTGGSTTPP